MGNFLHSILTKCWQVVIMMTIIKTLDLHEESSTVYMLRDLANKFITLQTLVPPYSCIIRVKVIFGNNDAFKTVSLYMAEIDFQNASDLSNLRIC